MLVHEALSFEFVDGGLQLKENEESKRFANVDGYDTNYILAVQQLDKSCLQGGDRIVGTSSSCWILIL